MVFYFTIIASFLLLVVYFKVAYKFNIIDKPNNRSSHTELTIRGAAVVFPVMGIIGFLATPRYYSSDSSSNHSGTLDSSFLNDLGCFLGLLVIVIVCFYDLKKARCFSGYVWRFVFS
jgi:hypothetical protein